MAKKKRDDSLDFIWKAIWFVIRIPYFIFKGIYILIKRLSKKKEEIKTKKIRKSMIPKFEEFEVLNTKSGNFDSWINKVYSSDSQIGIILGCRGSGKTAFGIKLLENFYSRTKKKCFALGFKKETLPSFISGVDAVSEIQNDSVVLVDEGGILFNSRSSMSNANKLLSELILISRHKNISIFFISQNSSNLEINVLRQADFLILKKSSLLQKDFERKIIQKIYTSVEEDFKKFSSDKGITYVYSGEFRGFVSNKLPSFWKESLSKEFK